MDDPNPHLQDVEIDDVDEPRSYALDYVLLDRSATDDPVWVLCRYTAVRAADLDGVGKPTPLDRLNTIEWATQQLMKVVNPRSIPGGNQVYRLEDGVE